MTDYIERDLLRERLINTPFYPRCETTPDLLTSVQDRLNDTLEIIDNFPAADVRPVVRGRWVVKGEDVICSACGAESAYNAWGASHWSKYCPNCGALNKEDERMNAYQRGEWDMFESITTAWHGKQYYFLQDDDIVYSRKSCKYMTREKAFDEFKKEMEDEG